MGEVRHFQPGDLEAVASLYEFVVRSGSRTPPRGLVEYLERFCLQWPRLDDDLRSMVYEHQGSIVGFLSVFPQNWLLDSEPVRATTSATLVVDPESRAMAAGVFLTKAYLEGAQEFSYTDGGTSAMRAIWERLGGRTNLLSSITWKRVLRPVRHLVHTAQRAEGPRPRFRGLAQVCGPLIGLLDAGAVGATGARFRPAAAPTRAEELTPPLLLEGMEALAPRFAFRPVYDLEFLEWVFREMGASRTRGRLRGFVLRGDNGQVLGWHLYYARAQGTSRVLQAMAAPGQERLVLQHLFRDAYEQGSAAVLGRLEPGWLPSLSDSRCAFHYGPSLALVHARDPKIYAALFEGRMMMTRFDGEYWMSHHLEPFDD